MRIALRHSICPASAVPTQLMWSTAPLQKSFCWCQHHLWPAAESDRSRLLNASLFAATDGAGPADPNPERLSAMSLSSSAYFGSQSSIGTVRDGNGEWSARPEVKVAAVVSQPDLFVAEFAAQKASAQASEAATPR